MKILTGLLVGLFLSAGAAWGGNYMVNPNGTVTDSVTGLIWQREDDNTARNWENALAYCENLTLGSLADWRLPNRKELESLIDRSSLQTIDPVAFPNTHSGYWSSTTYAANPNEAWLMDDFAQGGPANYNDKSTFSYYVRCVRGGQ